MVGEIRWGHKNRNMDGANSASFFMHGTFNRVGQGSRSWLALMHGTFVHPIKLEYRRSQRSLVSSLFNLLEPHYSLRLMNHLYYRSVRSLQHQSKAVTVGRRSNQRSTILYWIIELPLESLRLSTSFSFVQWQLLQGHPMLPRFQWLQPISRKVAGPLKRTGSSINHLSDSFIGRKHW